MQMFYKNTLIWTEEDGSYCALGCLRSATITGLIVQIENKYKDKA